ncbi:MAG: hypothetical protein OHK0021_08280 [Bryobacter sp.]
MTSFPFSFRIPVQFFFAALLLGICLLTGCGGSNSEVPKQAAKMGKMGERVSIGNLTYTILEAEYKTQLGTLSAPRIPKSRFLILRLAITNGGAKEVEVPMFTLLDPEGNEYPEEQSAEGIDGWFGMIRKLGPTSTEEGRVLFDVRPRDYRLEVTDGGETGSEKLAHIEIPMQFDTAEPIPAVGQGAQPASPKP